MIKFLIAFCFKEIYLPILKVGQSTICMRAGFRKNLKRGNPIYNFLW